MDKRSQRQAKKVWNRRYVYLLNCKVKTRKERKKKNERKEYTLLLLDKMKQERDRIKDVMSLET